MKKKTTDKRKKKVIKNKNKNKNKNTNINRINIQTGGGAGNIPVPIPYQSNTTPLPAFYSLGVGQQLLPNPDPNINNVLQREPVKQYNTLVERPRIKEEPKDITKEERPRIKEEPKDITKEERPRIKEEPNDNFYISDSDESYYNLPVRNLKTLKKANSTPIFATTDDIEFFNTNLRNLESYNMMRNDKNMILPKGKITPNELTKRIGELKELKENKVMELNDINLYKKAKSINATKNFLSESKIPILINKPRKTRSDKGKSRTSKTSNFIPLIPQFRKPENTDY